MHHESPVGGFITQISHLHVIFKPFQRETLHRIYYLSFFFFEFDLKNQLLRSSVRSFYFENGLCTHLKINAIIINSRAI